MQHNSSWSDDITRDNYQAAGPKLETLEDRLMLSIAPIFDTDLADYLVIDSSGGVTIAIDGYDEDGDDLDISVSAPEGSGVNAIVDDKDSGDRFGLIHFTDSDGNAIGDILVQLFEQRSPLATERFITLATSYIDEDGNILTPTDDDPAFYTDVKVHRVVPEFVIQTGDAELGTGSGGTELGDFDNEYDDYLSFAGPGVLSFANAGVNTNDSQFFITDVPKPSLDGNYTIFGQLITGLDVYNEIINSPRSSTSSEKPIDPPLMSSVEIIQSPQDGSITFWVDDDFTSETEVTVTLTDTNGDHVSQTITLVPSGNITETPDLDSISDIAYTAGDIEADTPAEIEVSLDYDGSLPLEFFTWMRYDGPSDILASVDASVTNEDGNYILNLTLPADYTGDEFMIELTCTVAGFGNLTPSVKRFDISIGERPVIHETDAIDMTDGATEVFDLTITDQDSEDFIVTATSTSAEITVSIDPDTYQLTVTTPDDFYGAFQISVTTIEAEFSSFTSMHATTEITFAVMGDRPTISTITNDEVRIDMGQTSPGDTITVIITDDHDEDINVSIETGDNDADANVTISEPDDANVYVITITIDADFLGGFEVTISAVEAVDYASGLEAATYTFTVTTLGDRPTIASPDDDLYISGGNTLDFNANISDDSGLGLDVEMTTNMDDTYVWLEEQLDAYGETYWQVYIDLRSLPIDYSGYFTVTISAIESDIDGGVDATEKVFYVITQPDFDPDIHSIVESEDESTVTLIDDDLLFVGSGAGVDIYDISDPANPQALGTYETSREVSDIEIEGDTLYVVTRGASIGTYVYDTGTICILDISDPSDIQETTIIDGASLINGIDISGNYIFAAEYTKGLYVYDISDLDDIPDPIIYTEIGKYSLDIVNDMIINGDYMYLMENSEQLLTIDISDPENLEVTDRFRTSLKSFWGYDPNGHKIHKYSSFGQPSMAAITGTTLVLADSVTGVWTFDIEDPSKTDKLGWLGWPATYVAVYENTAIISDDGFHRFVDLTDPSKMNVIQRTFAPGWVGMPHISGDGTIAALPFGEEGVTLIDMTTLNDLTTYSSSQVVYSSDADDAVAIKIAISGPGLIRIHRDSDNNNEITSLELIGASSKTTLTITTDESYDLCELSIYGSLRSLRINNAVVADDITIYGSINNIRFDEVNPDIQATLTITGDNTVAKQPAVNITAENIQDLSIDSAQPINRLLVNSWLDDESDYSAELDEVDTITAPAIKKLIVRDGDFEAGLSLNNNGDAPSATALGLTVINGTLANSSWSINGLYGEINRQDEENWTFSANAELRDTYVFDRRIIEVNDKRVIVRVSGGGAVLLAPSSTDGVDFGSIQLVDLEQTSRISISSPDGDIVVGDVIADNTLKSFDARDLIITGDIAIAGTISDLRLGTVGSGDRVEQLLEIDGDRSGFDTRVRISLDDVTDLSIISEVDIDRLTIGSWQDDENDIDDQTDEEDTIAAPYIGLLKIDGAFWASLNLNESDTVSQDVVLDRVIADGVVRSGDWTLNGRLEKAIFNDNLSGEIEAVSAGRILVKGDADHLNLTVNEATDEDVIVYGLDRLDVKGSIESSRILAAGNIGTITAGAISSSDIYAGYIADDPDDITALPAEDDFTSEDPEYFDLLGRLDRIFIRGLRAADQSLAGFSDSAIAAATIEKADIRYADTTDGGDEFGIIADFLLKYRYRDENPDNNENWNMDDSSSPDGLENMVIRIV